MIKYGHGKNPNSRNGFKKGHKINAGRRWKMKEGFIPWSKKNKGIHLSPKSEFKKGMIPWNKGLTKSKDSRISQPWLGKKRPSMSGENHPLWCNGNYKKTNGRNNRAYLHWRNTVKKRDGERCRMFSNGCKGILEIHHILPWKDYPEERYNINNGITLCQAHHPRKWAEEKLLVPTFQELVSQMNTF